MVTQRIERITQGWLAEGKREGEKEGFRKGKKIGIRKGKKIGIRKGEEIGIRKGELAVLRRLLERKFGTLSDEAIERLERADVDLLLEWSDRVLTATSLDEVFAE